MANKESLLAKIRQKTADATELPADIVAGSPRITLIGSGEVQIINHTGLLGFGEEQLRFGSRRGDILIEGERLRLRTMNRFEVLIVGRIFRVSFPQETEDQHG